MEFFFADERERRRRKIRDQEAEKDLSFLVNLFKKEDSADEASNKVIPREFEPKKQPLAKRKFDLDDQ